MTYNVRFGTGAGDETGIETVEEAKEIADAGSAYTGCSIVIEDDDGNEICCRPWSPVQYDHNNPDTYCEDRIDFGSFGYYADWTDE